MRDIDSDTQAALAARALVARDFIQITGKKFSDGSTATAYFWSDLGTVTAEVIDAITGDAASHDYIGTATLLKIDDIPLTSDVTVRTINASLSQINQAVIDAVRGYDLKQAPVQIHRGMFDPQTRQLVAPPLPRFVGFVDQCVINTPQEGSDGSIVLTLTSHTQELTRFNTAKCSDADQKRRSDSDNFYQDIAVVGNWQAFWGEARGSQAAK